MEAIIAIVKREKKHKRRVIKSSDECFDDTVWNPTVKSMIGFDLNFSKNIKFLVVKTQNEIKVKTRSKSGKLLIFAKVSLASFI